MTEPTPDAALSELIRLTEDAGLYGEGGVVPLPAICTDTYLTTRDFDSINETMTTYADARARHAVELERARVVALVREHNVVSRDYMEDRCGGCGWEATDIDAHSDHLADLIARADHERGSE